MNWNYPYRNRVVMGLTTLSAFVATSGLVYRLHSLNRLPLQLAGLIALCFLAVGYLVVRGLVKPTEVNVMQGTYSALALLLLCIIPFAHIL
jgi:hypothetical protein